MRNSYKNTDLKKLLYASRNQFQETGDSVWEDVSFVGIDRSGNVPIGFNSKVLYPRLDVPEVIFLYANGFSLALFLSLRVEASRETESESEKKVLWNESAPAQNAPSINAILFNLKHSNRF